MSSNKDDTLRQFCDVTGTDETRSRFFLESSNWQLEVALSSFYEHGGNVDEPPSAPTPANPVSIPVLSDSDMDSPPGSPLRAQKKDKKPKPGGNQKFATLSSLQQESSSDEEEVVDIEMRSSVQAVVAEKDLEILELKEEIQRLVRENSKLTAELVKCQSERNQNDSGQAFYAGGSDRSGQQILGPSKPRKDVVTEMFKSVRERGAVVFEDEPSSTSRGGGTFGGTGYRLGQTADDHEPVTPAGAESQESSRAVRLRLYREGFTVDAGPLRHYTDPQNAHFLNCIRQGEIPPELAEGGVEVRVSLEDRRHEECPSCPRGGRSQAFQGKGHLLGSPTPPTIGATAPVASDVADRAANERAAQASLNLNESEPVTQIQFRLADGTRLTGRFNHSHTIAQLRQYVTTAAPTSQLQNFVLMTTFPSAELSDVTKTVKEANLLNSVVVQRLK